MKHTKKWLIPCTLVLILVLFTSLPVFAAELTEAEVEQAVAEQGKETVTGSVFIWFLCAIAFLKVSQKIDSFMASLGINVGNTGGNMMAELLIAGRGISNSLHARGGGGGGGGYRKPASPGDAAVGGSFLSGGLAGSVGRHVERSAVNAATGYTENASIGNTLYQSSLQKGGDFANHVISNIAKGNYGQVGSIKGEDAANAYLSYMGLQNAEQNITNSARTDNYTSENLSHTSKEESFNNSSSVPPVPTYSNIEIGGGRITGTETSDGGSREFAMYHADQYLPPSNGEYETVQSVDGANWYKQYAQDTVERKPYEDANGKIAYHESIVQKLPQPPKRKDKI